MRKTILGLFVVLFVSTSCKDSKNESLREEMLFNMDWKFMRSDVSNSEAIEFDDSSWRSLDLPHDYSIEDLPGTESPFTPDAISGVHGGYTVGGTAWYRKTFDVPADWEGKVLELLFEGVYMNASVFINDQAVRQITTEGGYDLVKVTIPIPESERSKNTLTVRFAPQGNSVTARMVEVRLLTE